MQLYAPIRTIVIILIVSGLILLLVHLLYYIAVLFDSWEKYKKEKRMLDEKSVDKEEK